MPQPETLLPGLGKSPPPKRYGPAPVKKGKGSDNDPPPLQKASSLVKLSGGGEPALPSLLYEMIMKDIKATTIAAAKNLPSPIPSAGFGASVSELFDASEAKDESVRFARGMTGIRHPQVLLSKTLGNGSTDPTRAGPSGKAVQNTFGRFLSKAGPKRVKKGRQKEPKSRAPLHHATAPKTPTRVKK